MLDYRNRRRWPWSASISMNYTNKEQIHTGRGRSPRFQRKEGDQHHQPGELDPS